MRNGLLKPEEAADYLKVGLSTLARYRMHGTGPRYTKAGPKAVRYRLEDLQEYAAARIRASTSEQVAA